MNPEEILTGAVENIVVSSWQELGFVPGTYRPRREMIGPMQYRVYGFPVYSLGESIIVWVRCSWCGTRDEPLDPSKGCSRCGGPL